MSRHLDNGLGVDGLLDKMKKLPFYLQVAEILKNGIEKKTYLEGERLPTELELSNQFNVNRHTVRQALNHLASHGLVYTVKGKGTYVSPLAMTPIEYKISNRTSFSENILYQGLRPKAKLLSATIQAASPEISQVMKVPVYEPVYVLEILRFADEHPLSVATSYLLCKRFSGLLKKLEYFKSLYEVIEKEYNFVPRRIRTAIWATIPGVNDATVLTIPKDWPILVTENLHVDEEGEIVEYGLTRGRADRTKYIITF
ncbi:MAG: phosphonate metabolism transcriptional regulator PhnF [Thermincolia bacterium]